MMKGKRGQVAAVYGAIGVVMLLVMLGIVLSSTSSVVSNIESTLTAGSYAENISLDTLSGMDDYSEQQGTIWLVAAVGLIIAVLMGAFAYVRVRG